ncbi:MAG: hypothetical protein J0H46_12135 [Bacteroidetes bacterium]|nr:hypothetical protein [Bacteroidota bacterium]
MNKYVSRIALTVFCMAATASLVAQSQKKEEAKAEDKSKMKPKAKPIPTYLGNSDLSSGMISKELFDSLLMQGVTSKDSAGRPYKVANFLFTYGERNLYEDSIGNPMILVDYLSEFCNGDTLTTFLKKNVPERSKAGDTVIFDQITVVSPEGKGASGKFMKFVLTK